MQGVDACAALKPTVLEALTDAPGALAACIVEKFRAWSAHW